MELLAPGLSPETLLTNRETALVQSDAERDSFAVLFEFDQYYLEGCPKVSLLALFRLEKHSGEVRVEASVTREIDEARQRISSGASFDALIRDLHLPRLDLSAPLKLAPISIPKPWGQEIWYTGIEARGVSEVTDGDFQVPLPWVLALAPTRLAAGRERRLNLLKILDPLPEEVYGDLYFELHEEKQEVYVVTHVAREAWPDGVGSIRFGFDEKARLGVDSDEAFRKSYLRAVKAYESIRRRVDEALDRCRASEGIDLDAPVPASKLREWHETLPSGLRDEERALRQQMNAYTALQPLRVGDVVRVPTLTPHALQHGVRTVEFQTPVYERKILSFAQKVLTQSHWDTVDAVGVMSLNTAEQPPLRVLEAAEGYRLEEVVQFDDFAVRRLTVEPGCHWDLPVTGGYGLVMSVNGGAQVGGAALESEQALLLPAGRKALKLSARSDHAAIILVAEPI